MYKIVDENGKELSLSILSNRFGALWQKALHRLNAKSDGHLFNIMEGWKDYRVYRIV